MCAQSSPAHGEAFVQGHGAFILQKTGKYSGSRLLELATLHDTDLDNIDRLRRCRTDKTYEAFEEGSLETIITYLLPYYWQSGV